MTVITQSQITLFEVWDGEKGEKGDQGIQGIPGIKGADGTTYYTWIKYADSPTTGMSDVPAGKSYMGIAYNKTTATESTNYADYSWSLIKGEQGVQGIQGEKGADGQTTYTWVKYGTSSTGANMSDLPDGKTYIGLAYNKTTPTESTNPADYTWALIKGDQGVKGADGITYYTWLKYADTPTSGMSDSPTGKTYMGIAYNKTTPTESTNYADYSWSLIKGDKGDQGLQGIQGPTGQDGQTLYTWIKYADDELGNGMSDLPDGKRYLGLAYNKTTATESTNKADYNWSPLYDNVEVGGRNFAPNSKFTETYLNSSVTDKHPNVYAVGWGGYNSGITNPTTSYHAHVDTDTFGFPVYEFNESDGNRNWKGISTNLFGIVTESGEYHISMDAYATLSGAKVYGGFYYTKIGGTTASFHSGQYNITTLPVNTWGRIDAKVMLNNDCDFTKPVNFYIYGYGFSSNAIAYINKVKLEKGNVASGWTPSLEDIDGTIDTIGDKVSDIDERTSEGKLIETIIYSENFTSIMSDKADLEDISDMATGEMLTGVKDETVRYIDGRIDGAGGINEKINAVSSELTKTANSINAKFSSSGGVNLVKNSLGFAGFDFWNTVSGTMTTLQNAELEQLGFGCGFYSKVGTAGLIEQKVSVTPNKKHSLSFWLKKTVDNATNGWAGVDVYANGVKLAFIGRGSNGGVTNGWELGLFTFETQYSEVTVRVTFGSSAEAIVSGLMLNVGEDALQWQHANGEIYNTNIQMNLNGLKVINEATQGYTIMSPQEFSGYGMVEGKMERVFTLNGATTEVTALDVDTGITMGTMKMIPINTTTSKGWAFISNE